MISKSKVRDEVFPSVLVRPFFISNSKSLEINIEASSCVFPQTQIFKKCGASTIPIADVSYTDETLVMIVGSVFKSLNPF
jgi:hypothetical protein